MMIVLLVLLNRQIVMNVGVFKLPPGPVVMGVLNLEGNVIQNDSPPSIVEKALVQAEKILADGAGIIDISCEGSQDQLEILIPVIEAISQRISIPISIGTSNPEVMSSVVAAGAQIINDACSLTKLNALATIVALGPHVCLMHKHNDPVNKQLNLVGQTAANNDIVSIVYKYLEQRIAACIAAGLDIKKIIIDPGFGFGKSLPQNLSLLRSLHFFKTLNCPILVDISHKTMIGQILDAAVEDRTYGSVAAEVIAISCGADIIRSHNVPATVDAIKVINAI